MVAWTATEQQKYGVAIHNWHGEVRYGLPLDVGDSVEILEEYGDWFRGLYLRKPRTVGIFPKAYVHLKEVKTDPVVTECTLVLREWAEIWKRLFVERETYKFTTLRKVMLSLLESRRELLGSTLTHDQTLELQLKIVSKVDWGNRKLGLDLVPRNGPTSVNPNQVGIVSLHQVHMNSAENAKASSSRGTLRRKSTKTILTHHLYFCMRDFGHRIGDDAEVYFYLYDGNTGRMKPLSERFLVKISKDGFSNYIEKLHSNCTVFTDIDSELSKDLFLVATVLRIGKIMQSDSVKKGDPKGNHLVFRRPYGVGVLSLEDICQYDASVEAEEKEYSFKIFQCEEKDFHQLHELIIKKASGKFSPINANGTQNQYGLVVSLKLLHGGLGQARIDQPLLFQGTTITKKIGFPDVIMPGDVRNDLFLTLEKGEFERGGRSTGKNIEVNVLVLDSNGRVINECLFGASGGENVNSYKSMILYHQNSPNWNEILRLSIPIEKFSSSHVRFEFRHCSTKEKTDPKLFGFSFIRLMEPSGATIGDNSHELFVYKCEDPQKLNAGIYLKLPSWANDNQAQLDNHAHSMFHKSSKEIMTIKTLLCSTKLTQNADLLSLLQWRTHPETIQDSLTRVLRLKDEELVKFLQDVLDALFAMFSNEEGNSTEHSGLVFHVLVSIFSLLQSSKFQHFKPVINEYIENHFAAALVYKGLITSVQHLAEWMTTAERPEPIQKCFGSLEYIFKLIIQSRKLFAQATDGQYEESFRRDLYALFTALNRMLTVPSYDVIMQTQEALLHSTGVVLEQLRGTLPASELGSLAKNMLDAVPRDSPPRLIQAKLQAVKDLVSGQLFLDDECRSIILQVAIKHLRIHLSRRAELRLCSDILAEILTHIHELKMENPNQLMDSLHSDLDALASGILSILIQTILIIMEGSPAVLSALVAVLLGLLQQLDEKHYQNLWDQLSADDETALKDFLHRIIMVFKELVSQDWQVFPNDWLVMKLSSNEVVRKTIEELAKPLVYRFLKAAPNFDSQLWWSYFNLSVTFLTQPCLQLEQYHESKRRKILHSHQDMRVLMGFQILSMWSQLGDQKLHFIPSMVGPFLEVTLVPEPALRRATLSVFYDMMHCEQAARGSFRLVESELIDKLDLLISENKGDDEYRELFSTILLEKVHADDPVWREAGEAFITSVTRLLERLLDYRSVMQGEENRDKRMSCTVNLLNFYKNEINRKEMYLRYIYKLHDLHLQAENYAEAGFTLKLYADMLSWDREQLTFSPHDQHGQPEWQRKELLYHEIVKYFDKGKCWEKGIPLMKELALFYETRRFDYNSLSEILISEAKFFQNILTQLRPEPEYFRVGFFGLGFPLFVRNKQFIYRGLEYERIGAFTQRLQTEFPQAQILSKNSPPEQSVLQSPEQFIQISNVRPVPEVPSTQCAMVPIPDKIARFYSDVTRFIHDRPNYKGTVDKDNEFKSLWIERTTIEIASPLPGILRWFEVTSKSVQELNPVEFACETMGNVGKELWELVAQYRADPRRNINPFSMRLQGVIDANVMGGISKYQEAFFDDQFLKQHPKQTGNVQRLKSLILEQMQVLETALELHGQLAPSSVQPLHKRLLERFQQLRHSLSGLGKLRRQHSESIVNTPLPPLPIEKRTMSLGAPQAGSQYHDDDNYTKPLESAIMGNGRGDHGCGMSPEAAAPPIPARPKSAGYMCMTDSPEVPPKGQSTTSPTPPLPPRDKRNSNPFPDYPESQQAPPRRHKYSVVDIDYDDGRDLSLDLSGSSQQALNHSGGCNNLPHHLPMGDYRDSGISTSSHDLQPGMMMNNLNQPYDDARHSRLRGHQKTNSNPEALNIMAGELLSLAQSLGSSDNVGAPHHPPPPIPPKSIGSVFSTDASGSFEKLLSSSSTISSVSSRSNVANGDSNPEGYCLPRSPKSSE